MYNNYLEIKPAKTGSGRGIFTTVNIPADVPVLEITGDIFTEETMPDPNHPALLQIWHNLFIGPSGNIDDLINHSCNPNCYLHIVGQRAILYSRFPINNGSEITFDYSTSSTDSLDKWQMNCVCGSFNCRKIISGFHLLDEAKQKELKNNGLVPMFMTNKIFRNE